MAITDLDDPAIAHQQCAELVTQLLVLNKDLPAAAKALGLKPKRAAALAESETFIRLRDSMVAKLSTVEEAWQDMALARLRSNIPMALGVLESATQLADKWGDKIKAADSLLDRAGVERHTASEIKHIVSLDQESIDRLTKAAAEADAIDVTAASLADFSYARQRPITQPLRHDETIRENPNRTSPESQGQHLLPGQSHPGLRGSQPERTRRDGNVDSEPVEAQIRPGPA